MIVIDDFLKSYDELKALSLTANFGDISNPADGVIYPFIFSEIPDHIKAEVQENLERIFRSVTINYLFMRKSPKGVAVPHMAHTDNSMGDYSLMLYMQDDELAGTGFLRHVESGITYCPESESFAEVVRRDQNNPMAWSVYQKSDMKQNRAAIFDAHLVHCALPVGGFGSGDSARCVLTAFFTVNK